MSGHVTVTCSGCGDEFEARHRNAKWCSDRCRKAAVRREPQSEPVEPDLSQQRSSGLVASVTQELESAGVAETFAGQLAIALAKRLSDPDESGISSLSKELRTVMASALEGKTPPSGEGAEPEDEVAKARGARERKARQAANRA